MAHLMPGGGSADRARRAHRLESIFAWIEAQDGAEQDYVIVGDMNVEDCAELGSVLAEGFASLNDRCQATNTNPNGPRPYDHVMYHAEQAGS